MNKGKNELMQFVGGLAMLAVGLFIFSQKVIVHSGFFGGGLSIWGYRFNTGLVIVPLIIGIVWMFATGASFPSKVFTGISVLFIIAVIVLNTNIRLMTMTLYDWVIILILIFGGAGLTAKVLLAENANKEGGKKKNKAADDTSETVDSIDRQLEEMKKKYK